jgi:aspartokinase
MIKVSDIVLELLQGSEIATEAMRLGVLNLRAFARQIQPLVERRAFKPVKIGTIVVALSRLRGAVSKSEPLNPVVLLDEISIKSPLVDVTFEKTRENTFSTHSFSKLLEDSVDHFFTVTQGINEITFIVSDNLKPKLLRHFSGKPKALIEDLVGLSVRFSDNYLPQPNVIYAILSKLAVKRINVIEIVSTYTELMIIIEKKEMELAVTQLNRMFKKGEK